MLDKFSKSKVSVMSAYVIARDEAMRLARSAAAPIQPGESIKAQMRRSAERLGMARDRTLNRRHRAAWYGEAGSWGADLLIDLQTRFTAWQNSQRHEDARVRLAMADDLDGLAERLSRTDPSFFGADIEGLRVRSRQLRGVAHGSLT